MRSRKNVELDFERGGNVNFALIVRLTLQSTHEMCFRGRSICTIYVIVTFRRGRRDAMNMSNYTCTKAACESVGRFSTQNQCKGARSNEWDDKHTANSQTHTICTPSVINTCRCANARFHQFDCKFNSNRCHLAVMPKLTRVCSFVRESSEFIQEPDV